MSTSLHDSLTWRTLLSLPEYQQARIFWDAHLEDAATAVQPYGGAGLDTAQTVQETAEVDGPLFLRLHEISRGNPLAQYVLLQAAWLAALYHGSGERRTLQAIPVHAADPLPGGHTWLPFAFSLAPQHSFREHLGAVRAQLQACWQHQHYPLAHLLEAHHLPDAAHAFTLSFHQQGLHDTAGEIPVHLRLTATWEADRLRLRGEGFTRDIWGRQHTAFWLKAWVRVLEQVAFQPDTLLSALDIGTAKDRETVLEACNPPVRAFDGRLFATVYRAAASAIPEAIQARQGDAYLTRAQLYAGAERIAQHLRAAFPAHSQGRIALLHSRDLDYLTAFTGILLSGFTLVPLDPRHPAGRIQDILTDAEPLAVLACDAVMPLLHGWQGIILTTENLRTQAPAPVRIPAPAPEDIAYVIYTSGTSGKPKGVEIRQRSLILFVQSLAERYCMGAEDTVMVAGAPAFDIIIYQILPALCTGAGLYLLPYAELHDFSLLSQRLREVNFVQLTSSLLTAWLLYLEKQGNPADYAHIRFWSAAAEPVQRETLQKMLHYFPQAAIWEEYGPTETTVAAASMRFTDADKLNPRVIGTVWDHVQVYILGPHGHLQAPGAVGEICIGGPGVGQGYLNRPALTAEKFVPNPFRPGEMMYRSGDLGRWLPDGSIEFQGRADAQVKIRGFRIEPEEICRTALAHPDIADVQVIARQGAQGSQYLAAYFLRQGSRPDKAVLQTSFRETMQAFLSETLPDYMIPAVWVEMPVFPHNSSGKLDMRALPDPDTLEIQSVQSPPQTPQEILLAGILCDILNLESIGIDQHFIRLGGDSLKAIQAAGRLRKLGKRLELSDFFVYPTVREMALRVQETDGQQGGGIPRTAVAESYPVSDAQRRLYFLQMLEGPSVTYNIPAILRVRGALDAAEAARCFRQLILRHESLRTSFFTEGEEPRQRVHADPPFTLVVRDAAGQHEADIAAAFIRPFDLGAAPLFRAELVRLGQDESLLLMDVHHIVFDGASLRVLTSEFLQLYAGMPLMPLPLQYRDYAVWQAGEYAAGNMEPHRRYWMETLAGELPVLNLATDFPRPPVLQFAGDTVSLRLDADLATRLRAFSRSQQTTPFVFLFSVFSVLLSRYSGQEEILAGTPVEGRPHADLEKLVGMFVNTLVLRSFPARNRRFREFMQETGRHSLEAFSHQEYPFEELVRSLVHTRDLSRNPLFDVMFSYQNQADTTPVMQGAVQVEAVAFDSGTTKFDLQLDAADTGTTLQLNFQYSTALFSRERIVALAEAYTCLLEAALADPDQEIGQMPLLRPAQQAAFLSEWEAAQVPFASEMTLNALFEQQVNASPDAVAVVFGNDSLSYAALNARANQVAHRLSAAGITPDQRVAVVQERGLEMVISLLGILKAGGAYLPIDPETPLQRLHFILEDSGARIVLTENEALSVPEAVTRMQVNAPETQQASTGNLPQAHHSRNLAYVIYTSGSTGKPKGVLVEHRGVMNRIEWMKSQFSFSPQDIVLQKTAYTFDVSVWEFFTTLCYGGRLIMTTKAVLQDVDALVGLIAKEQITCMHFVPGMLKVFLSEMNASRAAQLHSLRWVYASGEALPAPAVQAFYAHFSIPLYNLYGPTEASVEVSYYRTHPQDRVIPIGRPIWNTELLVLDESRNLLPPGVPGELYLGGAGLARGYLNLPELTAEKFVPHPWRQGARLYRTGDLVQRLPDGNIVYLGRIDFQVKIRGFRIELGEVEAQLLRVPGIREAAVVDARDAAGDAYLCAYYAAADPMDAAILREALAQHLPDYMIPSRWMQVPSLPVNSSGKLDRKALPQAGTTPPRNACAAPVTDTEIRLAALWAELLGVPQAGRRDHFFDLGGHSLIAMRLVSRVKSAFGIDFRLISVFQHPVLEEMASVIDTGAAETYEGVQTAPEMPVYPASAAQRIFFSMAQVAPESTGYNMPMAFEFLHAPDYARLEAALGALLARHEILRTVFFLEDDRIVQSVQPPQAYRLEITDCTAAEVQAQIQAFIRPFRLDALPLIRARLLRLPDGRHIGLLDLHHILGDGASLNILTAEFLRAYQGENLPALPLQYKDFSVWQDTLFRAGKMEAQRQYWLQQLGGELPVLNLPADFPRPAVQQFEGDVQVLVLKGETVTAIRNLALSTGATNYMVLMAALKVLLSRYASQEEILIGTPVSGRPDPALEGLIGMFVNTLVIRTHPVRSKTFREYLREVQAATVDAISHQDYPFPALAEALMPRQDLSRNPLFDVMFAYQIHTAQEAGEGDGLEVKPYGIEQKTAKFDLQLDAMDLGSEIHLAFTYSTHLFLPGRIARMAGHFRQLLDHGLLAPDTALGRLEYMSAAEQEQLTVHFNDTARPFADDETLDALFEAQAALRGDAIALSFEGQTMTYAALNRRVNQLAHYLRAGGVQPDTLVAIQADRGFEMVIALLAVQKAGGAYLPLDPEIPVQRLAYILRDSGSPFLLTDRPQEVPVHPCTLDLRAPALYTGPEDNPPRIHHSRNLAYCIYTSGSTGQPKGTLLEHRGVVNRIAWMKTFYGFDIHDTVLQKTPYTFDVSVWEFFIPLCYGARLALCRKPVISDVELLTAVMEREGVTTLHFVPSMLKVFLAGLSAEKAARLHALKRVFASGEALSAEYAQLHHRLLHAELHNLYGPTEASVEVTYYETRPDDRLIPIGKPVWNTELYILDADMQCVPLGVPGELHLGGVQLARGYLNQPELTAQKFIPHPWRAGERLYKTGDLARWLPDGNVEFLGRLDHQVKIRGFRIETGDIEAQLLRIPGLREVAVLDKKDAAGDPYLCAYVVSDTPPDIAAIQASLRTDLPEYMIPARYVHMQAMPLNASGKLDRKSLPEPDAASVQRAAYAAPETEMEHRLVRIWQQLLRQEQIGVQDHFFALGGDSIKAIQLGALLLREGYKLELSQLFLYPTIRGVAGKIGKAAGNISQVPETGTAPFTPVQARFLEQQHPAPWHYNQSLLLEAATRLDAGALRQTLDAVVYQHDALRLRLRQEGDAWSQYFHAPEPAWLDVFAADSEQAVTDICAGMQGAFEADGPLFRAALIQGAERDYVFLLAHHWVVDAVSWRILAGDIMLAYAAAAAGNTVTLPEKTHSWGQWARALQAWAQTAEAADELALWAQMEQPDLPSLVRDHTGQAVLPMRLGQSLTAAETQALLDAAMNEWDADVNTILLAAFARAYAAQTGQAQVRLSLESHGREASVADLEISRTLGWFTSIYPVLLSLPGGDAAAQLEAVRTRLRSIPRNGIGYGALRYLNSAGQGLDSRPEMVFNYLGHAEAGAEADTGLFALSGLETGAAIAPANAGEFAWSLTGVIGGGCLHLSVDFDAGAFLPVRMEGLLAGWLAAVRDLTAVCAAHPAEQLQPEERDALAMLEPVITTAIMPLQERGADRNLFLFPPAIGFSLVYQELAAQLDGWNVYGINFLESPARMRVYVREMLRIQGDRPFVLGGYSGGANLAWQVAAALIAAGAEVAAIVMLDGMRNDTPRSLDAAELKAQTAQYISEEAGHASHSLLPYRAQRSRVRHIVAAYQQYLAETADAQRLPVRVLQILSEQEWEEGNRRKAIWAEVAAEYETVQGLGAHSAMLSGTFFEANLQLLRGLLAGLETA